MINDDLKADPLSYSKAPELDMKVTSNVSWKSSGKVFLPVVESLWRVCYLLFCICWSPCGLWKQAGLQEFKINGLINGRHYLDLVGNNQIQLTLRAQEEVALSAGTYLFHWPSVSRHCCGTRFEKQCRQENWFNLPCLKCFGCVPNAPTAPHHHSAQSQEKWRTFCLNCRYCCGMWDVGCDAVDNFTPVNHFLPFLLNCAY